VARIVAFTSDLLFGSRLHADLSAGGHEVELVSGRDALPERLGGSTDVLVVDLTDERLQGAELVEDLAAARAATKQIPRTLGFYSHVDIHTRQRAQQAGFDMVVPRSRMAREGPTLIDRLAGGSR
jgi:CheY-like chemotaxis protein